MPRLLARNISQGRSKIKDRKIGDKAASVGGGEGDGQGDRAILDENCGLLGCYAASKGLTTARCVTTQNIAVLDHIAVEACNDTELSYFTLLTFNEVIYVPYFLFY
jgi:hypothetical protein